MDQSALGTITSPPGYVPFKDGSSDEWWQRLSGGVDCF